MAKVNGLDALNAAHKLRGTEPVKVSLDAGIPTPYDGTDPRMIGTWPSGATFTFNFNAAAEVSVYIAGPMRGLPNFNYDTFGAVEATLNEYGLPDTGGQLRVKNPATNFGGAQDREWAEYMSVDLQDVLNADVLVLLPGYENSEGAQLEIAVAKATGKRFFRAFRSIGEWHFEAIETPGSPLEGIEQEAKRLVYGDRAKTYGHPRGDFDRVAKMWSAILDCEVTAEQVAIMMVAFKLARLTQTPGHHDSQVDTIGYMLCLSRLQEDK